MISILIEPKAQDLAMGLVEKGVSVSTATICGLVLEEVIRTRKREEEYAVKFALGEADMETLSFCVDQALEAEEKLLEWQAKAEAEARR